MSRAGYGHPTRKGGVARGFAATSAKAARPEPRSVSEGDRRRLWRGLCEAAARDAGRPDEPPVAMVRALDQLKGVTLPLAAGDLRRTMAEGFVAQATAFAACGAYQNRRDAAAMVTAGARYLEAILFEQGAAVARASMARIDPGEREDD